MKKPFMLTLNLQYFSADTGAGGGYDIDPEQLGALTFDEDEPVQSTEVIEENEEIEDSEEEEIEDTEGAEEEEEVDETDIPDLHEVVVDGVSMQVSLDDLKKGYMMQSAFTKKTQGLADERKSFEQEKIVLEDQIKGQFQQEYGHLLELGRIFQANPEVEQAVIELLQKSPLRPSAPQLDQMPEFQEMRQKLTAFEQQQKQWEEMQMRQAIQAEWNDLYNKFPDVKGKEEQLAQFADAQGLKLEQAYMIMNFNNVKTQTQTEMVKKQMKKRPAGTMKPANSTGASEKKVVPKGYDNIEKFLAGQSFNLTE